MSQNIGAMMIWLIVTTTTKISINANAKDIKSVLMTFI